MTPGSPPWSAASAPCRIEWRPSRWLIAALLLLGLAAPVAVLASELPAPVAGLLAAAAAVHGLDAALREWRRAPCSLVFTGDGRLLVDGQPATAPRLRWRGPLAFLAWRDPGGRRRRLAWWPDTLPPGARRELRLAADGLSTARPRPSVAP